MLIRTRFAAIQLTDWGCVTIFPDGASCPSQHHPDDPHYRVVAHRCGYGDDTLAYAQEHDLAHLIVEEMLHARPSRVLWGLAHGAELPAHEAVYEEMAAQALQRFVRAAERPIIGQVDWNGLRARFLAAAGRGLERQLRGSGDHGGPIEPHRMRKPA